VPGADGIWRDLTDNVNQHSLPILPIGSRIADVANAVTSGDLTRSISVRSPGRGGRLEDTINQ